MPKEAQYFKAGNITKIFNHFLGATIAIMTIILHYTCGQHEQGLGWVFVVGLGIFLMLGRAGIDLARDYFHGDPTRAMPEK